MITKEGKIHHIMTAGRQLRLNLVDPTNNVRIVELSAKPRNLLREFPIEAVKVSPVTDSTYNVAFFFLSTLALIERGLVATPSVANQTG